MCFDTGGLDIKSDAGMLNMKKDMGGAACVLAAAHMIMDAKLKVRLRVLIPAVENAIARLRVSDAHGRLAPAMVHAGGEDRVGAVVSSRDRREHRLNPPRIRAARIHFRSLCRAKRGISGANLRNRSLRTADDYLGRSRKIDSFAGEVAKVLGSDSSEDQANLSS